nr:MAG TPA: Primase 1 (PriCT 1) [Caudoviricetes sp.]
MNYWTEFGGILNKHFTRNIFYSKDNNFVQNKENFIRSCRNRDVYQCAYNYEDQNIETCRIIGDPYLDFDAEDISRDWDRLVSEVKYVLNYLETALGTPVEEFRTYFSGNKGFHIIIPALTVGLKPARDLNTQFKYFATGMAFIRNGKNIPKTIQDLLDLRIYDRRRLFRVPNTVNSKSGRYKVPVTIDQIYSYSYSEMIQWAKEKREENFAAPRFRAIAAEGFSQIIQTGKEFEILREGRQSRKECKKRKLSAGKILELLPCAQRLLESSIPKGSRNSSCFALSSSLFQAGYKMDNVYQIIEEWNNNNEEPLSDKEIATTINSASLSYEKDMYVGCGAYRELDLCVDTCKLLQN